MKKEIKITNKIINDDSKPFIIAELSANHLGKIKIAKKLILEAKKSGADAVKIQTYTADTMTINSSKKDFLVKSGIWKKKKLYDLYTKGFTPWSWHKELFNYARKNKIILFGTPYDETSLKFLKKLNNPIYKIASFEMNDHDLIKEALSTNKPTIISTGMSSIKEIDDMYSSIKNNKNKKIILLHCISAYPSNYSDLNLKTISTMKKKYNCVIGFSDHTLKIDSSLFAVAMGAKVIEKHLTLSRKMGGVDSKFSLEPHEFKKMTQMINDFFISKGKLNFSNRKNEKNMRNLRRSIYVTKDLKKGEKFSIQNIRKIRPGKGLHPKFFKKILGKKSKKNISVGTALNWSHLR